ncbi:hypothetical protein Pcinc_041841 [Petrolisthes cinctipes]|uniref:Uncharacterized protein n=1 Tax=Petrolisthes cinctipes TaxID=88211 RepID=A0AAE1BL81_PETCI|nr:hypothetical protein Pcinc_041841 [Petrolisthes cinctipes]
MLRRSPVTDGNKSPASTTAPPKASPLLLFSIGILHRVCERQKYISEMKTYAWPLQLSPGKPASYLWVPRGTEGQVNEAHGSFPQIYPDFILIFPGVWCRTRPCISLGQCRGRHLNTDERRHLPDQPPPTCPTTLSNTPPPPYTTARIHLLHHT